MIGRLRGRIVELEAEELIIDVGGVGYVVRCGARALARLTVSDDEIILHIESQTREDGTRLYGFLDREEQAAFLVLQAVQGVGPKAALAVLDVLTPAELASACAREDKALVARANGVGPKLAQRIVSELKDKPFAAGASLHVAPAGARARAPQISNTGEATAALMGLGYAEPAARRAVEQALARLGPDAALPALIKAALQEAGR
ncbi:MAG: Holliday junction branch migration protein RuvA [Pseudomonadota bacterium]|jgi:Holliday junction DNA helicase RuvA